eukprot:TRINITY_DN3520_c1_g1_i1.p1 TRINITY_DN3520_c1_g1~~TRINITY_DN3520_c1_g1_i1.p1  ORF type:complete len:304 (-),score=32.05 TRINITY_DN3520_c1_g1_i1:753-1532(-)
MSIIKTILLTFVTYVTSRQLLQNPFLVVGDGLNTGGAFAQTQPTLPVYTPGSTSEVFDTVLEVNFTNGIGRFLGYRNTAAQTFGPGEQLSSGTSNITGILGTEGFFLTQGTSFVNGGSQNLGDQGANGSTLTNTSNNVILLTGPDTPKGSFAENSLFTTSIREGLGAVNSFGSNQAASLAIDFPTQTIVQSDSRGAAQAGIVGYDTISFVNGSTFSTSGSEETVTGCEQAAGAAALGVGGGVNGTAVAACSSRGQFIGY